MEIIDEWIYSTPIKTRILIRTIKNETLTPIHPTPMEQYIKIYDVWFKKVENEEELQLLKEK